MATDVSVTYSICMQDQMLREAVTKKFKWGDAKLLEHSRNGECWHPLWHPSHFGLIRFFGLMWESENACFDL